MIHTTYNGQNLFSTNRILKHWGREQKCRHIANGIFKRIFSVENVWISLDISPKFVSKVQMNNNQALVQIMSWRRPGDKPLSEPIMVSLPMHIRVIRPQWVKTLMQIQYKYIRDMNAKLNKNLRSENDSPANVMSILLPSYVITALKWGNEFIGVNELWHNVLKFTKKGNTHLDMWYIQWHTLVTNIKTSILTLSRFVFVFCITRFTALSFIPLSAWVEIVTLLRIDTIN